MLDDSRIQRAVNAVSYRNMVPIGIAVSWEDYQELTALHGHIPGTELAYMGIPVGWQERVLPGEVYCYGKPFEYGPDANVVLGAQ